MLKYFRNLTLNVSDFLQREQVGECWKLKVSNSSPSLLTCMCSKGHYSNPPLTLSKEEESVPAPEICQNIFPSLFFPQKVRKWLFL